MMQFIAPFLFHNITKYCSYQLYSGNQLTSHHQTGHSAAGSVPGGNHSVSK